MPDECAGGWQATEKPVFLSDVCADGWRTAEKSVIEEEYVSLRRFYSSFLLMEERMTKKEAIRIIVECARLYHENLEGKNLLFIFGAPQNPERFETVFMPRHILHLTGVYTKLSSSDFYDRCLKSRLSVSDFVMPNDGTVEMKLAVLPQLMRISKTAKMIGDYDSSKSLLYTEKLAGGDRPAWVLYLIKDSTNLIPPSEKIFVMFRSNRNSASLQSTGKRSEKRNIKSSASCKKGSTPFL